MTCCQWANVRFCHLCAHSKWRQRWLAVNKGFLVGLWVTKGKEPVVDGFPDSPHSIQIPHPRRQSPSTYEAILSDHPEKIFQGSLMDLPSTKVLVAARLWLVDAVDSCTSQTHTTNNSTLPHALMGRCKHFTPNTYRGWTRHY